MPWYESDSAFKPITARDVRLAVKLLKTDPIFWDTIRDIESLTEYKKDDTNEKV